MRPACWDRSWPRAPQAGKAVAQLRQLDLGLALFAAGVLGKNVQDHGGAVDGGSAQDLFQVARLGRRQLVVEHHRVGVGRFGHRPRSCALPRPDVRGGVRPVPPLVDAADHVRPRSTDQ